MDGEEGIRQDAEKTSNVKSRRPHHATPPTLEMAGSICKHSVLKSGHGCVYAPCELVKSLKYGTNGPVSTRTRCTPISSISSITNTPTDLPVEYDRDGELACSHYLGRGIPFDYGIV